jgi:hypothetical protein
LLASRNKQVSGDRGKQKYKGDLALEPWRLAAIGEIGLGPVRLYGSYSLNQLQKTYTRMEQYPYTIGIRFSSWSKIFLVLLRALCLEGAFFAARST